MANAYTLDDLLEFLAHAGDRGMMPAATASALAVAVRNVFGVLSEAERNDLSRVNAVEVVKRFNNKRAKEFSSSSLKEYGRRAQRAVALFNEWREDPANFSPTTRTTRRTVGKGTKPTADSQADDVSPASSAVGPLSVPGSFASSFPIRPDHVVTVSNVPADLTAAEAERLAKFVRMLAVD